MSLRLTACVIGFLLYNTPLTAALQTSRHAVPVEVKQILVDPVSQSPVVILEGTGQEGIIPIWIGTSEAASIALQLEQRKLPRPNTHDLIRHVLSALDATLERVTVTELRDNTYFAVITVKSGERELHIDSRPSDAIAVALRAGAPIYAAPELFNARTGSSTVPSVSGENRAQKTLGIQVQDLTPGLANLLKTPQMEGVLIADVVRGSPASRVGLARGDVITRIGKSPVHNTRELEQAFAALSESEKIDVRIERGGRPMMIVVDLRPGAGG